MPDKNYLCTAKQGSIILIYALKTKCGYCIQGLGPTRVSLDFIDPILVCLIGRRNYQGQLRVQYDTYNVYYRGLYGQLRLFQAKMTYFGNNRALRALFIQYRPYIVLQGEQPTRDSLVPTSYFESSLQGYIWQKVPIQGIIGPFWSYLDYIGELY